MKSFLFTLILFIATVANAKETIRTYGSTIRFNPEGQMITLFNFKNMFWDRNLSKGESVRIYKWDENEPDIVWVWFGTYKGGNEIELKDQQPLKVDRVTKGDKFILPEYSDYLSNKNKSESTQHEISEKEIEDPTPTKITEPSSNALNNSINAGVTAGVTTAASMVIYRSLIMSYSEQKAIEKLNLQTQANIKKAQQTYSQIDKATRDAHIAYGESLARVYGRDLFDVFDIAKIGRVDRYVYKSPEGDFRNRVVETRGILNSIVTKTPEDAVIKQIGLETTEAADEAYADGQKGEAEYLLDIALQIGDMLVGWDPITGTARSFVQAVWGRDPFTGEKLSNLERAFAALGVVTGGYGSKVLMGLKTIQKIASKIDHMGESAKYAAKLYELYLKERSPGARKFFDELRDGYERYKHGLQGSIFTDPQKIRKLVKHVNKAWSNIDTHLIEASQAEALTSEMRYAYRHPTPEKLTGFDDPSKVQSMWLDRGTILYRVEGVHDGATFGKVQRKSPLHVDEIKKIEAKHPDAVIKYYVLQADTPVAAGKALGGDIVQYNMPFNSDLVNKTAKELPLDELQ